VGLAPASQPRIVVAVMVDAPSRGQFYGGQVAGPVFGQVVQQSLRLLGVPHDIEVQTQLVVDASGAQQESF
jgi:cell division protein FtsI (penicillin-binding protein 3)